MLVDTSVWIDHLGRDEPELRRFLEAGEVECHEFVIGELACGRLRQREEILLLLDRLPKVALATHRDALHLIELKELGGAGLGWVDVHLLASALLAGSSLWTRDRRLGKIAERLGVAGGPT